MNNNKNIELLVTSICCYPSIALYVCQLRMF